MQVSRRAALDARVAGAVRRLLASPSTGALPLLHSKYGASAQLGPLLAAGLASPTGSPPEALVAAVVGQALPRPAGAAVVDDWDCLRVSRATARASGPAPCAPGVQRGLCSLTPS